MGPHLPSCSRITAAGGMAQHSSLFQWHSGVLFREHNTLFFLFKPIQLIHASFLMFPLPFSCLVAQYSRYFLLSPVPRGYKIKQDQTAVHRLWRGRLGRSWDGPFLSTLAQLLIKWKISRRGSSQRSDQGVPGAALRAGCSVSLPQSCECQGKHKF